MVSHDYYLDFGVIRYILAFYSGGRSQESGVRSQETGDYFYLFSLHPTPYTRSAELTAEAYTPHPTPHTPHTTSPMIAKKLHQEGNNFQ
ncbi:DNA gyrase subunit A [Microcystis aeruginosa]